MTIVKNRDSAEQVKQEIQAMHKAGKRVRASKASAKAYLHKNGFITKTGKLTKRYGG